VAEGTINAAGEVVGPVDIAAGASGVICVSGTMTTGYLTLFFKPNESDTYFPCDEISISQLQLVRDGSGIAYGYCSEIALPCSGRLKVAASTPLDANLLVHLSARS
jgi:hypothetical protein